MATITPIPKSVPVVLGVIFCDACNQFLIFPFIPFLVRSQLALEPDDPNVPLFSGILAAAYLFGQFACSPFYGGLSERLGRRPVLLVCVLISTFFLLAFGFSESYVLSLLLRLLQGAFAGALTVGKLYLADVSDASNEGRVFSFIGIAIGSGCICGPAIGGYLADPSLMGNIPADTAFGQLIRTYPYLAPCLAGAAVSLAIFFAALFSLKESRAPPLPLFTSNAASPSSLRLTKLGQPLLSKAGAKSVGGAAALPPPPGGGGGGGVGNYRMSPQRSFSFSSPGGPIGSGANGSGNHGLTHNTSNHLLESMAAMGNRGSSLIVSSEDDRSDGWDSANASPQTLLGGGDNSLDSSPKPVAAVTLALRHSLSPAASRVNLFDNDGGSSAGGGNSIGGSCGGGLDQKSRLSGGTTHSGGGGGGGGPGSRAATPMSPEVIKVIERDGSDLLPPSRRQSVFWIVQLACLFFALTNVGLTEVLPVWLSTPPVDDPNLRATGGLGMLPSLIGNLQSTTGVGNIVLALFVTYRIINYLGPVNTFSLSLFVNACAAFGPPLIQTLPEDLPDTLTIAIMCVSYSLVAASRNMMFATALMLSKEAAPGGPGVAIGINQSACSLGSALGPMVTGLAYTQSLTFLHTCVPFFVSVGVVGALPGFLTLSCTPAWPWKARR